MSFRESVEVEATGSEGRDGGTVLDAVEREMMGGSDSSARTRFSTDPTSVSTASFCPGAPFVLRSPSTSLSAFRFADCPPFNSMFDQLQVLCLALSK